MNALELSQRTVARVFAAVLASLVLGASGAQPAPADGVAAGKTNALLAAPSAAAPPGVHISPHARAARERAAAQAQAGPTAIRVSPFTDRRKPHNVAGGR